MKPFLTLSLLGPLDLQIDKRPLSGTLPTKAEALLCYLAVQQRPFSRQALSSLLWGEMPDADARRNLRGVVMRLRSTVNPFLQIDHQSLAFDAQSAHLLDITRFDQAVTATDEPTLWQTAVDQYRGDFLTDFVVRDAPDFEHWVERQRLQYRQRLMRVGDRLLEHYQITKQYQAGQDVAQRLLEVEPLREATYRHLMRLLAAEGQRQAALDQFEIGRSLLWQEVGVEPTEETAVLAEQIRQGRWSSTYTTTASRPNPPAPKTTAVPAPFIAGPPIQTPAHFFGRERVIRRLFNLVRQQPLQNAAIIGPRRSGKTSLLQYLRQITRTPPNQLRPNQRHDWLPTPQKYQWVFVDFQDARLGELPRLLTYLLQEMGLTCPDQCELPQFLDIVSDELTTPTIMLLDEIGVALTRYPALDDAFWESLRSLATNQVDGNLGFVLTSHQPPQELAQSNGYGSPFFNIFAYTAVLGPLTETAVLELIQSAPLPFSEEDQTWIMEQSQRWPMPLQILCRECLLALEDGLSPAEWRADALAQAAPFLHHPTGDKTG
jgi:DNA-binding SARP family transcriptional activator